MIDFEQVEQIASKLTPQYIAGFFDGEGSVTVTKDLALQVSLNQSNESILAGIAKFFGCGSLKPVKSKLGHKQNYQLRWCGKNAEKVLTALVEYLIVKHSQAKLGLELSNLIGPRGSRVADEVWQKREEISTSIKTLNDSHWSRRPKLEQLQNGMLN